MGKKSIWRRVLAVVLALSMVCSVQTMSVYADIFGLETRPVQQTADQPEQNETEPTVTPTPTPEAEATPTPIPESDTESENEEDGSRVVYTNHISTVKDAVKFRSAMNTADDSNIITVLQAGTVVKVLAKETVGDMEWYQIKAEVTTGDTATGEQTVQTQTGYVSAEYLDEPQMVQTEDSTEEKDPEITGDDDQESEETPSEETEGEQEEIAINQKGTVNQEASMLDRPADDGSLVETIPAETEVTVLNQITLENGETWYQITVSASGNEAAPAAKMARTASASNLSDGISKSGYVKTDFINLTPQDDQNGSGEGSDVTTEVINRQGTIIAATELRKQPGTGSESLTELAEDTTVQVLNLLTLADGTQWYEIQVEGQTGYVSYNTVRVFRNVSEAADYYYGTNGTLNDKVASVNLIRTDAHGSEIKAGEYLTFLMSWKLERPVSYDYGNGQRGMFDHYDNSVIYLTLPEGMSIVTASESVRKFNYNKETGLWELHLDEQIDVSTNSYSESISFNVRVDNNGILEVGHDFKTKDGNLIKANMETSFQVVDRNNGNAPVAKYEKNASTSILEEVKSVSDDQWAIQKIITNGNPSPDADGKITFSYELKVGLKNLEFSDGTAADSGEKSEKIISDANSYAVTGRTTFDQFQLTEGLTVTRGETTLNVTPESIQVTPAWDSESAKEFSNDATIDMPFDTCGGKNLSGITVDASAPYLSTYTVEVTYDYDDFVASWTDEDQSKATVENTATLTYSLLGDASVVTDSSSVEQNVGEVSKPAQLTVGKNVKFYSGESAAYGSSANQEWGSVEGAAEFTVYSGDGTTPAKLYNLDNNGKYVERSNTISIDRASDEDGRVTVYLMPGTYVIKETKKPSNTEFDSVTVNEDEAEAKELSVKVTLTEENGTAQVIFTNKAEVGRIKIQKTGTKNGQSAPEADMNGAVFGLYQKDNADEMIAVTEEDTPVTATTADGGIAYFNALPAGTYYVRETTPPSGYMINNTLAQNAKRDANGYYEVKVTAEGTAELTTDPDANVYNGVQIQLQKQILSYNKDSHEWGYVSVNGTSNHTFDNCFVLQKWIPGEKENEGQWKDLTQGSLLSSAGTWIPAVATSVYDENGEAIKYRFKETLPKGWEGNDPDDDSIVYMEEFTLEEAFKNGESTYTVTLRNWQTAELTLTKTFLNATTGGNYLESSNGDKYSATFKLYRQVDNGAIVPVTDAEKSTTSGKVSFTELPVEENGTTIFYYLEETAHGEGDGGTYILDGTNPQTVTIAGQTESRQLLGPYDFSENMSKSVTATNVQQKVPVKIVKTDNSSGDTITGAEFKVEVTYDVADAAGQKTETHETVTAGEVFLVDAARGTVKLKVTETKAPKGYEKATEAETYTLEPDTVTPSGVAVKEFRFENKQYPSITVNKKLKLTNGTETSLTAQFEVYTKDSETFVSWNYKGYEDEGALILTAGTALNLPVGQYYLHEIITNNTDNDGRITNILDPDKFPETYKQQGEYDEESDQFYFKLEVKEENGTVSVAPAALMNYTALGDVKVTKKIYDVNGNLNNGPGATLAVYEKGSSTPLKKEKTGSDGTVTFENLPVYKLDKDGDPVRIQYEIKEVTPPSGYEGSDTVFETVLKEGKTIDKVITDLEGNLSEGDDLTFINYPLRDFTVTKVARDLWEYEFTGKDQPVKGAVIALYRQIEEGETAEDEKAGNYKLVGTAITDDTGAVSFLNLGEGNYVAVEVSCPEVNGKETRPEWGTALNSAEQYLTPEKLVDNDENSYYFVKLDDYKDTNAKFVNVIDWTQLEVQKISSGKDKDEDKGKPVNGAVFELYRQEITTEGTKLSFDKDDAAHIGTYSSGTLTDPKTGKIIPGKFATDILEVGENIVYWLVETEPGPGYKIIPANQIILLKHQDATYKNESKSMEKPEQLCTQVVDYTLNGTTELSIENDPLTGPGEEMYAYVRLAKWAQDDGSAEYKPLGGAKYKLYLTDRDHNIIKLIDEMTTGLDSDIPEEGASTLTGTAAPEEGASTLTGTAASIRLDAADYKTYINQNTEESGEGDIAWSDADGNIYVRMMLQEVSAPFGYKADSTPHYLIVKFSAENSITYNETYFVFDKTRNPDALASELKDYPQTSNDKNYRLVNEELPYQSVTVRKYGYTPTEDTLEKTSEELDAMVRGGNLLASPLEVTMTLERKNSEGQWQYVDINGENLAFTSDSSKAKFETTGGTYTFPHGLQNGLYRIKEVSGPAGYELLYDDDSHARYFEVTGDTDVVMFNPTTLSLSVAKTDTDENKVTNGVSFTLTGDQTGSKKYSSTKSVSSDGQVTFTGITSGKYKLTETVTNTELTGSYLDEY